MIKSEVVQGTKGTSINKNDYDDTPTPQIKITPYTISSLSKEIINSKNK